MKVTFHKGKGPMLFNDSPTYFACIGKEMIGKSILNNVLETKNDVTPLLVVSSCRVTLNQ